MENFDKTVKFEFKKSLNQSDLSKLQSKLKKLEGINTFELSTECIYINYVTYHFSNESLKKIMKNLGFQVKSEKKKKKGLFKRFIDKLAKTNKETYGSKKLDCCDLKD